ncbi:MAG: hypothetical protein K0S08_1113 [Gammaproteobacteria bacterium]|jgi:hypothetical protein|nr:hypothetical protein [Gammaproteobacteria bacterium]
MRKEKARHFSEALHDHRDRIKTLAILIPT